MQSCFCFLQRKEKKNDNTYKNISKLESIDTMAFKHKRIPFKILIDLFFIRDANYESMHSGYTKMCHSGKANAISLVCLFRT